MKLTRVLSICALVSMILLPIQLVRGQSDTDQLFLEPTDLGKTSGFLAGQQETLDRIEEQFPSLANNAKLAKLKFESAFGVAIINIEESLKSLLGDKYPQFKTALGDQIKTAIKTQQLDRESATQFLSEVNQRSLGLIASPILETLLYQQFKDHPEQEFTKGFRRIYRTKDHEKSKGLDIQIEIPKSWSAKEGNRPNIIQKFRSINGNGPAFASIQVRDIALQGSDPDARELRTQLNSREGCENFASEVFSENILVEMAKSSGAINIREIKTTRIVIDNWPGAEMEFVGEQRRLDLELTMYNRMYFVLYKGKLFSLQCQIWRLPDEQNDILDRRIKNNEMLFDLIANSIIIQNQY